MSVLGNIFLRSSGTPAIWFNFIVIKIEGKDSFNNIHPNKEYFFYFIIILILGANFVFNR